MCDSMITKHLTQSEKKKTIQRTQTPINLPPLLLSGHLPPFTFHFPDCIAESYYYTFQAIELCKEVTVFNGLLKNENLLRIIFN